VMSFDECESERTKVEFESKESDKERNSRTI